MAPRRSRRTRKSTLRDDSIYNDEDIFGPLEPDAGRNRDEDDSAEEFTAEQAFPDEKGDETFDTENEAEDVKASAPSGQDDDDISDVLPPLAGDEGIASATKNPRRDTRRFINGRPTKTASRPQPDEGMLHTRGVPYSFYPYVGKDKSFAWLTGGVNTYENECFLTMSRASYDQVAFPSRKIRVPDDGGMYISGFQSEASRKRDAIEAWNWYNEGIGQQSFVNLQETQALSSSGAEVYCPNKTIADLITGHPLQPRHFPLPPDDYVDAEEAFQGTPLTDVSKTHRPRRGWLVNLGAPTTCLAWVPNRDGPDQYLAISLTATLSAEKQTTSAFAPGEAGPSSIHILGFRGTNDGEGEDAFTIDSNVAPRRVLSMCFNYGRVLQFKWCPIAREHPGNSGPNRVGLGLLAVVTADGNLRVIDVTCSSAIGHAAENLQLTRCAFQASPDGTVCTCVSWISSTLIAAGCANGFVVIWDLERHFVNATPSGSAVPDFYHHCHDTYIVELSSCYASNPHLILSSSMDGYSRLTDLRDPHADSVVSLRSRQPLIGLEWMDSCLSFVGADDSFLLKGASVRLMDHFSSIMKHTATPTAIATSPVHTCVLVGCADGTISGSNAMRRLFTQRADAFYRQVWFQHEWRRGQPIAQSIDPGPVGPGAGEDEPKFDFPNGLSRLTTGFSLENTRAEGGIYRPRTTKKGPDEMQVATLVYERETAITNIAWNPNLQAGGWAAAAMGSGLMLVEDLCHD